MKKNFTLLSIAFLLLLGSPAIAQIIVTNSNDSGMGSLRQAVIDASAGSTITFALTTNGNTIMLDSEITIDKELTINGNGDDNTIISGNGSSRIFVIADADDVTINNIAFTDGAASDNGGAISVTDTNVLINNSSFSNNTASGATAGMGGGALYITGTSEVTVNASTFTENEADGSAGSGGAILVGTGSNLTVNGCTITGNMSVRAGGGIEGNSGAGTMITLTDVTLEGNSTASNPGNGGGLHITGAGDTMITGGIVTDNTATAEGGGLWNGTGTMNIDGTVITSNTASGAGADQGGGGIYNLNGGTLVIANATISDNTADGTLGSGGGILNDVGSQLTITDTEISGNTAIRAGGGIEDNSGTSTIILTNVELTGNSVSGPPGNGGGLHITGSGSATITGGTVSNNSASLQGGGLWNGSGTMTIANVTIEDNEAGGDAATDGGGGVFNVSGTVEISDSTLSGNLATGTSGSGGGIFSGDGMVTIDDSTITLNSANRAGGGIEIIAGDLTVNSSFLNENNVSGGAGVPNPGNGGALHISGAANVEFNGGTVNANIAAREGGGLWNQNGSVMTVNNLTISGNTATGVAADDGGGGIFNNGGTLNVNTSTISGNSAAGLLAQGGGIHINTGTANIVRSTISGNTALTNGGGIYNNGELMVNANTITLNSATVSGGGISNNSSIAPTITNTIVAGNLSVVAGADLYAEGEMITSMGYNLIGIADTEAYISADTDISGSLTTPLEIELLALGDNGGSTFTHKLGCPSPAADMGNPDDNSQDQLGQDVFNGRRDIGAYESQEACSLDTEDFTASANRSIVYPNPSVNGVFNLELAQNHNSNVEIAVYDLATGKLIMEVQANTINMEIGMQKFASGTYVMQIVSDAATETHKLIIRR